MTRRNLQNIKGIFSEKTGVCLRRRYPAGKVLVLAAALAACLALAGFGYPLFSPLDQDQLSLRGQYEGRGIVSVYVENGSDKELRFQEQLKLVSWLEGEVPAQGQVLFSNTRFPAHSSGVMTVDLSGAYDIGALEKEGRNPGAYYLLLTNHDFVFGHDWMCSFRFQEAPEETQPNLPAAPAEETEPELAFYFSEGYSEILAWNERNFQYLQAVDELVKRRGGYVAPVYPLISVSGPATMLEPQPQIQGEGVQGQWQVADGYGRLVGGKMEEKALAVCTAVPSTSGGESMVPVGYLLVYDVEAAVPEGQAFVYGKLRRFREMEPLLVRKDEHYAIYNATAWICPDVEHYLTFLQATRPELDWSEETRENIRRVYTACQEPETLAGWIQVDG